MTRGTKIIFAVLIAIVLILGSYIGGFASASAINALKNSDFRSTSSSSIKSEGIQETVGAVYDLMSKMALEVPSEETATLGVINGLLQADGDTHSQYLPPKVFEEYSQEMTGKYAGIGVSMNEKDGQVIVIDVFEGSPAEKAGIEPGDIFSSVENETKNNWTSTEISNRVRGDEGTEVTITMIRPYEGHELPTEQNPLGKPFTVTIKRAVITTPNVTAELLEGSIGYIKIGQFNQTAADDTRRQIESLTKKGAKSFILDLRNNPGGLITQAVDITSLFVKEGDVVRTVSRVDGEEILSVSGDTATQAPLVVLVNENSASASEIVAGALQDHERATVLGMTTFGKGSVQSQVELKNGGAILLTTAHYQTPKGRTINRIGLTPDIESPMDFLDIRETATDSQLKDAIKTVKGL